MWPNLQFPADLIIFTREILNEQLHFLCTAKLWLYTVEPFFTINNHLTFLFKTAIDGGYSEWSDWTECSVSCGIGTEERERHCNNPLPSGGGKDCEEFGPATEIKQCKVRECPGMLH